MSNQVKLDLAVDMTLTSFTSSGMPLAHVPSGAGGVLWMYEDGAWGPVGGKQQREIDIALLETCEAAGVAFTEKERAVYRSLGLHAPTIREEQFDTEPMIAFRNGTFKLSDSTIGQNDPANRTTRRLPMDFDPTAVCPEWLAALDRALDDKDPELAADYKTFLQQWFGMALVGFNVSTPRALRKLLMLEGIPGTAKTSVAEVVRALFGEALTATGDLKHITSRFGTYDLTSAKAWIADDAIGKSDKVGTNALKKIITGEPMHADIKGKQAIQFRFQGPCLLTTNNLPKIDDNSHALYGRVVMLRFTRQFSAAEAQRDLKGKPLVKFLEAEGEFPGIVNWAIAGAMTALADGQLHNVTDAYDSSVEWRKTNDPLFEFIHEHCSYDPGVFNYAPALVAMISTYSDHEHGKRTSPSEIRQTLSRELPTMYPGVKPVDGEYKGGKTVLWTGLRVSEDGIGWLRAANEKGYGSKWPTNQSVL